MSFWQAARCVQRSAFSSFVDVRAARTCHNFGPCVGAATRYPHRQLNDGLAAGKAENVLIRERGPWSKCARLRVLCEGRVRACVRCVNVRDSVLRRTSSLVAPPAKCLSVCSPTPPTKKYDKKSYKSPATDADAAATCVLVESLPKGLKPQHLSKDSSSSTPCCGAVKGQRWRSGPYEDEGLCKAKTKTQKAAKLQLKKQLATD